MRRLVLPVLAVLALAGCGAQQDTRQNTQQDTQQDARHDTRQDTGAPPVQTVPISATSEAAMAPKLSPQGKDALARAKRSGAKTVVLTVATERDKTNQVAADLRSLGAAVEATDATIGYVRVSVPVDLAERVTTIDGISGVDVDEPLSHADPTP